MRIKQYSISVMSVWLGITILYISLTIVRHLKFESSGYDLGIFDQALWNLSQLRPPVSTLKEMNILTDHFSPVLILLTPLYWLWNDVRMILAFQVIGVMLAVIPIIRLIQTKLSLNLVDASLMIVLFSVLPGIQQAVLFDFHPEVAFLFVFSVVLYSSFTKNTRLFIASSFFCLLIKEDMVFYLMALVTWLFLKRNIRFGLYLSFEILIYLVILISFISVNHSNIELNQSYFFETRLGGSTSEILHNLLNSPNIILSGLIDNPIKVVTLIATPLPFAFIPLITPLYLIVGISTFIPRMLLEEPIRWSMLFHYSAIISVVMCFSIIEILDRFKSLPKYTVRVALVVFIILTLLVNLKLDIQLKNYSLNRFYISQEENEIRTALKTIPKTASISAQGSMVPHLSHRREIYQYPQKYNEADYIVLSLDTNTYPFHWDDLQKEIVKIYQGNTHQLITQRGNTYIFKKL